MRSATPPLLLILGVAGSGKTTIGSRLATLLGCRFVDADDLQTQSSIEKLASGRRLDDQERREWVIRIRAAVREIFRSGQPGVIAFPGLRVADRDFVVEGDAKVMLVFLEASLSLLKERALVFFDHIKVHVIDIERYGLFLQRLFRGGRFRKISESGTSMFISPDGVNLEIQVQGGGGGADRVGLLPSLRPNGRRQRTCRNAPRDRNREDHQEP